MRAIGVCLVKGFMEDVDAAGLDKSDALSIGAKDASVGLHRGGGENGLVRDANIVGGSVGFIVHGVGMGMLHIDEVKATGPDFILVCGHDVSLRVGGIHMIRCIHPGGRALCGWPAGIGSLFKLKALALQVVKSTVWGGGREVCGLIAGKDILIDASGKIGGKVRCIISRRKGFPAGVPCDADELACCGPTGRAAFACGLDSGVYVGAGQTGPIVVLNDALALS